MELTSGYKRTDVGVIPEAWECTTIANVAAPVRNAIVGGPFGSDLVSRDYVPVGVPVIRGQNMGGRWVAGDFVFVSQAKAKSLSANLARPMDVVFTQRGTLGQVSVVPELPYEQYLVSQSQMKLTVDARKADPLFCYHQLTGWWHQKYLRDNAIQTGVPHLNLGIMRRVPWARPPLPEQHLIAAALDDVDALIAHEEQLVAKRRDVKQAVMQRLLTGEQRLPGFNRDWIWRPLSHAVEDFEAGVSVNSLKDGEISPLTVLKTSAVSGGRYIATEVKPIATSELRRARLTVRADTVIISRMNTPDLVGECGYAEHGDDTVFLPDRLWMTRLRTAARTSAQWLAYVLSSAKYRAKLREMSTGTSGSMKNISKAVLLSMPLAFPEPDEQRAIAAVLADMDAELAALEQRLTKAHALKQAMMQELLTGRTRLTPPTPEQPA